MKKKTKIKFLKGILCVLTGFFLIFIAYYERKIDRSPLIATNIEENNNLVYKELNRDNLIGTLKSETGVVLFVSSRSDLNRFINLLYDLKGDYTIYVYSLKNDELVLSITDGDKIDVKQKQSKLYGQLVDYLGVYADDYVLFKEDGEIVKTEYKKVYTPTVLFIKKGKPVYSYSNISDALSDEDLTLIYKEGYEILMNGYDS